MKKNILIIGIVALLYSCGGGGEQSGTQQQTTPTLQAEESTAGTEGNPSYDPHRGEGKFTEVAVDEKLDVALATAGESVFGVKCAACHKLTDEKLVGPGWKGVTTRRKPVWLMNFITNPDPMIDKDPELQAQLEICLVRMPNQGLNDDEARQLLEFMRKNDGVQ